MRLRNVKNKEEIMNNCSKLINNPYDLRGNWKNIFNNDNPIHIEIGMGKGDFIMESAKRNPNINYIGIEKYDSVIATAIKKLDCDLNNLYLIRMNANQIEKVFDKEIDCIYLNFSDPWPKDRHHRRRLTSVDYLMQYDKIFKQDNLIIQKTDDRNLFEYSVVSLTEYGYHIDEISLDLHANEPVNNIMTEYERKFVNDHKTIYYLKAKK